MPSEVLLRPGAVDDLGRRGAPAARPRWPVAGDRTDPTSTAPWSWPATWAAASRSPAAGRTRVRWEALATAGALDLTVARVLEPHVDALAILAEATVGEEPVTRTWPDDALWGVYAAEGPGGRLTGPARALRLGARRAEALVLPRRAGRPRTGHRLGRRAAPPALRGRPRPPGRAAAGRRPGLGRPRPRPGALDRGRAARGPGRVPCGPAEWYLDRPGFALGGAGVAAVWLGGAVGLARRLRAAAAAGSPTRWRWSTSARVDAALARSRAVLLDAAGRPTRGRLGRDPARRRADLLAARVRQVVAEASRGGAAARRPGPGPRSAHRRGGARPQGGRPDRLRPAAPRRARPRPPRARRRHADAGGWQWW